jgi:hypothetical protein
MPLEELIIADQKLSEIKAFSELSKRAELKIQGSPQVDMVESPLRLISFITESHHLRPM